ncbi:CPBP family intramembrane metalloprotease [Paludibacter sp. 221]|uniref:CPBP family intramembrane glutamic endopeptidase n=1 Tax=Paludibacter sp. 221 TaxID=2302939 RepID=UPI0013D4CEAB|nr:type II CAAX endopeptidase family protein [Paludibacter sp. 221]NDV47233.1 CPBP family intramembrane metalloprotease [Paludibacter sp. 221]
MGNNKFLYRFFIVAFIWSWVFWLVLILAGYNIIPMPANMLSNLKLPLVSIGAFGPLVGALSALRSEFGKGAGKKYLKTFVDLRWGWKAYVIPVVILGGITCIAWLLPEAFGEERLYMLLPSVSIFVPYLLIMIFFGGGQEEFGWRGYALPRMESSMGMWKANVVLGVIWAVWHLPLWFVQDTSQMYMNFGGFVLLTVGYSFIFSWVLQLSGNRPLAGLYIHGLANAFIPLMPILIMKEGEPQVRFWIWVSLTFVVGIVITIFRSKKGAKPVSVSENN